MCCAADVLRFVSAAKAAEMALKLSTHNRWCVTGTPVHRGLEDLYGLALFLGSAPWCVCWLSESVCDRRSMCCIAHSHTPTYIYRCDKTVWNRALLRPYLRASEAAAARTHKWVSQLFWRTQKQDILHEISLPPQVEMYM